MSRFIFLFVFALFSHLASAQIKVTGVVTDEGKNPLPGVSVIVKGTTKGTATDFDGNYEIQAKEGDVLEFSFIGFHSESRKVTWGGKSMKINVLLKEEAQQLEDVVVVGFATQKKENLTGSVTSVDTKVLEARPVSSAVQALQGAVPGMNFSVGNSGGELNSSLSINIRGGGTIGAGSNASPLVLIDGMEGNLATLNPQDIESISVLKDAASASIYGSRAAFGVILVTTKSGKEGRTSINYSTNFRLSTAMNTPEMLDSEQFAYYFNDAARNGGGTDIFRAEIIEKIKQYKAGEIKEATRWNPNKNNGLGGWEDYANSWANVNWFDQFYRKWAPSQEHNLSIKGGTKTLNYYLSLGWLGQEGFLKYNTDTNDRYSVNAKISSQILPYLRANYNLRYTKTAYERSSYMTGLFYHNIARRWPTFPVYDPNGNFMPGNEIVQLNEGKDISARETMSHQLGLVFNPIKNWVTNVELNYNSINNFNHWYYNPVYRYGQNGEAIAISRDGSAPAGDSKISESASKADFVNINIYSSYDKQIGKNNFKVLAGFQSELYKTRALSAQRDKLYSPAVIAIAATGGENDEVGGSRNHWATAGFFGRLNYNFDGRYLLEGNIRYDGTSRFLRDQRWNVFTSASIGWNVAKENFWESLGAFGRNVSEFKFRASYGELGNQNTGNWYPFYQTLSVGTSNGNWLLNNQRTNTAYAPGLTSSTLTWEKVASWTVGFDLSALNNRLKFNFDVFNRKTYNMVGPAPELPTTLGTSPARINNTDMISKGFEATITWRDKIGEDFSYGISANVTDSRQQVTKYPNETGNLSNWYSGKYSGEIWGYESNGIAKTAQEMTDWLVKNNQNQLGTNWGAGDIMYKDLNGDGVVDGGAGTLDNPGDLKIIGNSTPRYNFGINLDAKYKNFDFSIFIQGVGKRDLNFSGQPYFRGADGPNIWQSAGFISHLDYFRPEGTTSPFGPNLDAYYPRPIVGTGHGKNFHTQDRWLQDASYFRVKNIQLGYTLPIDITKSIGINHWRVYFSAENLYTFTRMSKIFDPEANGGAWGSGKLYPLSSVISTGMSITF